MLIQSFEFCLGAPSHPALLRPTPPFLGGWSLVPRTVATPKLLLIIQLRVIKIEVVSFWQLIFQTRELNANEFSGNL